MDKEETLPPKKRNWTVVWAAVAAIATVGAFILAAIPYLKPAEFRLIVDGRSSEFSLPQTTSLDAYRASRTMTPDEPELFEYRSQWSFISTNRGNREVKEAKLILPFDGYFEMSRDGARITSSKFVREIPVGSLRSLDEVIILVWTKEPVSREVKERMRLVHPEGNVKVHFHLDEMIESASGWAIASSVFSTLSSVGLFILIAIAVRKLKKWIKIGDNLAAEVENVLSKGPRKDNPPKRV